MSELRELIDEINAFRDARDWRQFHNAKDVAISLSLEASELLELFQWTDSSVAVETRRDEMADELADVLTYALTLAEDLGLDPAQIVRDKLARSAAKYPVELSRGNTTKYDKL